MYTFDKVTTAADFEAYHAIRKAELFDNRKAFDYNPHHPDETAPGNTPLLLKFDDVGIATARFDNRGDGTAIIRLVAVLREEQGLGHGRKLLQMLEQFAHENKVGTLYLNANPTAVKFYLKSGYTEHAWNASELTGISSNSIQMMRQL